jgi:hypothetical protein
VKWGVTGVVGGGVGPSEDNAVTVPVRFTVNQTVLVTRLSSESMVSAVTL